MKMIRPVSITDSVLVSSTVPETDYGAYSSGTTYALAARVIVTTAGVHKIYESLQNGNVGHDPTLAASASWWLLISSTNRWKMFDASTGTQTTVANTFTVVLAPGTAVTSIAMLNVLAANVVITMTDPIDGVVFSRTIYTAQSTLVGDWDSYFFDYVTARTDLVVNDLPAYANATLTIQFNNGSGSASCGVLVVGRAIDLGNVQYGAKFGITDYSTKAIDAFGGYQVVERGFSKRASYELIVPSDIADSVATLLTEFRATPAVWIGSERFQGTFVYGFWKDWDVSISYPTYCICTLTIEGLS